MWVSSMPPQVTKLSFFIDNLSSYGTQGLSRYLETGCPNRGFVDFACPKCGTKYILLIR